jgi:hypothetical protein
MSNKSDGPVNPGVSMIEREIIYFENFLQIYRYCAICLPFESRRRNPKRLGRGIKLDMLRRLQRSCGAESGAQRVNNISHTKRLRSGVFVSGQPLSPTQKQLGRSEASALSRYV